MTNRVMPPRTRTQRSSTVGPGKIPASSKGDTWPKEIKSGSVTVKIYRTIRRGEPLFCVTHYLDNRRNRKNFANADEAETEARRIANKIANSEQEVLQVSRADWRLYTLAVSALKDTGVPIDVACREYAEARKIIGVESLISAAKQFVEQDGETLVQKCVPELVEEFILAKINAGIGKRAVDDYRSRLRRFAKAFQCPIDAITKDQLQEFLDVLKIARRTKKNFKASISTLFDYARSKKCLPREQKTEAEHLDSIESEPTEIEVFTPKIFEKLVAAADPELVPYLVIRAFTGVRDSEINRMEWSNVKFDEGYIEIPAASAKRTRAKNRKALRRLVPIHPNLATWLAHYRDRDGKICAFYKSERVATNLAKRLKIRWVHNGLRHGYGSYRVAQTKNYPLVAYEMGNSVEVIKACYDRVVTEQESKAWFAICPQKHVSPAPD